jgi:hypothetical protein
VQRQQPRDLRARLYDEAALPSPENVLVHQLPERHTAGIWVYSRGIASDTGCPVSDPRSACCWTWVTAALSRNQPMNAIHRPLTTSPPSIRHKPSAMKKTRAAGRRSLR